MADNETKIGVEAEITVDSSKATSGLDKAGKSISENTKKIKEYSAELDKAIKKHEELGKAAEKSSKKQSASQPSGLYEKAEATLKKDKKDRRIRASRISSIRDKGPQAKKSPAKARKAASVVEQAVNDSGESLEAIGKSAESISESISSLDTKAQRAATQAKNADTRAKNADSRGRAVDIREKELAFREKRHASEEGLRRERERTEHNRGQYWQEKTGRVNSDHRYKSGLYGGIASGVGGMISRARGRGGLSGFGARIATGIGLKHQERNIMKGATISGLGLNALTLAGAAAGAAIAKLIDGIGNLGVESLQAYGEVDKLKTSLSVVYGSDVEADAAFEGLKEYSLESPFGVEQTTEMAILLKQSGVYGTELLDTMRMIGDTAGGNAEKFQRIANNYAQIASIGKASMLDMRQFAYAGIPIYRQVAEELGVSQSVLRQMISDGEVTNEVIEKVFKTMTSEGGEFYQAVERGAQTLNARLVNLQDSMNLAKAGIGEMLFKGDLPGIGSSIDDQGALGGILSSIEELVRKADDWARLRNIERDISSLSDRREAVEDIDTLIAKMLAQGKDVSALQEIRADIKGASTPESDLAIQYEAYTVAEQRLNSGSTENLNKLEADIKALKGIVGETRNKELEKVVKDRIAQLEDELDEARKYSAWKITGHQEYVPGKGIQTRQHFEDGEGYAQMSEFVRQNAPAMYQVKASNLATTLLERGQKRAGSASSLGTWSANTMQAFKETDQGKAEAERRLREEHDRKYAEFTRLTALIDDTGRLLKDADVDIGEFVDLMKSGIITPLEEVSLAFHDLAVQEDDTYKEASGKREQWAGLRERAAEIEQFIPSLPPELAEGMGHVVAVLEKTGWNSEANVNELNNALTRLSENPGFADNQLANLMTEYLLVSAASANKEAKSYDELYGRGKGDEFIALWKRITGSVTGIDPGKITTARDFYSLYTSQFAPRNISQGVISGMVSSGKGVKDIAKHLRYTGGTSQADGTMAIDWGRTSEALAGMATSASATHNELEGYSRALHEQIDVMRRLQEVMFTTGEDWEKLEESGMASQLLNAFSYIGQDAYATNAAGERRDVEVGDDGRIVFKGTSQSVLDSPGWKVKTDATSEALDNFRDSLENAAAATDTLVSLSASSRDSMNAAVMAGLQDRSARRYLETGEGAPDSMLNVMSGLISSIQDGSLNGVTAEDAAKYRAEVAKSHPTANFLGTDRESAKSYTLMASRAEAEGDDELQKSITGLVTSLLVEAVKNGDSASAAALSEALYEMDSYDAKTNEELRSREERRSKGKMNTASMVEAASYNIAVRQLAAQSFKNQTAGVSELAGALRGFGALEAALKNLAVATGDATVTLEDLAKTRQDEIEQSKSQAMEDGNLAAYGQAMQKEGAFAAQAGDMGGVGTFAAGKAAEIGANLIQGTDAGAFVQGTMQGGPLIGLVNMLMNALGNVVGGIEVLGYALNPVTHLLQGLAPLIKVLILPLVLVSRGLEMLGEMLSEGLTWIVDGLFGEGAMESIDNFYNSLTGNTEQMEEAAQRLEALNEMLEKTRQSIMEAEEYFLVQNRTANAQWAAQMQGQLVMDTRAQNVNDMILTPHGNFSTAPDDYIIAMKDPASLMASGGGGSVVVKFTVNNNASDVVEAVAEERDDGQGQKELMVTISRMVAADYASGRNGWDAAYSGRENRAKGRSVSR